MPASLRFHLLTRRPTALKVFAPSTITAARMSATGIPPMNPSQLANLKAGGPSTYSSSAPTDSYQIKSTDYQATGGLDLTDKERLIIGSVLDLFAGKPTLKKLSLWTDDATFKDPLTDSAGRKQYSAQWYGLAAAFSEIERLQPAQITSLGNPITLDLKTRYKVKGIGTEKVIESQVKIFTDDAGERITAVEDRWGGNIPDGPIAKIFRGLNAATVPVFVSVPKSEAEEAAKKD